MSDPDDQLPPYSGPSEEGVLGCLFQNPDLLVEAAPVLRTPMVFFDLRCRHVYEAMLYLQEEKLGIDTLTVHNRLKEMKVDIDLMFLTGLPDAAPVADNLGGYMKTVHSLYLRRCLLKVAGEITTAVFAAGDDDDIHELCDSIEKKVMQVSEMRSAKCEVTIGEMLEGTAEVLDGYVRGTGTATGVSTGYNYLDKMICGLKPAEMITIAGRPGMGKTSLVMNVIETVACKNNIPTAVFSLEMTAQELANRFLFSYVSGDFQRFRTGFLTNDDVPHLSAGMAELSRKPLYIDDSPGLSIGDVRTRARRMRSQYGLGLIVVDYLQLMVGTRREYSNREREVAEISVGIKNMAKELKLPVIVAAQLNREFERNPNRKPQLSDLRESGSVEQDSDVVGFLYRPKDRPEDATADWSDHSSRVNLLIAKQRNGPTGDVELLYRKSCMKFTDYHRVRE